MQRQLDHEYKLQPRNYNLWTVLIKVILYVIEILYINFVINLEISWDEKDQLTNRMKIYDYYYYF